MTAECPVCGAALKVADDAVAGELIECKECGSELEIKAVQPLTLAEAPMEEEDWGE